MNSPRTFLSAVALALVLVLPAAAAERVALVIGNNAYTHLAKLPNPRSDARAVGETLKTLGFEVIALEDATVEQFYGGLEKLKAQAADAKLGLVYFAGHGVEIDGKNYLLPVDAELATPGQLRTQAIALDAVLGDLRETKLAAKLAILDCCRDDPLSRDWLKTRSVGTGGLAELKEAQLPASTMVMFSAGPGQKALDGAAGQNSPFTAALVKRLRTPGQSMFDAFLGTSDDVVAAAGKLGKTQEPWVKFDGAGRVFRDMVLVPGNGGGGTPAPRTIRVGEFASMTGGVAVFGNSSHEGTLLAIERINEAGGVLGRPLELLTEDDRSRAGGAASAVGKLISKDGVVAILGGVASSRALEAAPLAQQKGIPMISPAATHPTVTQAGDYIFRACFTDPLQGSAMASFAAGTLKARKLAVLGDEKNEYAVSIGKLFKESTLKLGGKIVADHGFSSGDKDFKAQLTAIKASDPDAVFVPCYYPEAALIAIQARQLGLTVPLLGVDGWESESLVEVGKEAVEGHYLTGHYSPETISARNKAFVEAYKKRFDGKIPDAMAALGYDSAYLLADAIRRAGSTEGPALRDALAATSGFEGATGKISMNRTRDAVKEVAIFRIEAGKFKFVSMVSP